MDYYAIAPTNHLDLVEQEQKHLIVAQLLEDDKVFDFYRKISRRRGSRIILDNGVIEHGQPMKVEDYLDLARRLQVDEIIAPDHWKDPAATVEAAEEFMDSLSKREQDRYTVMGAPHGRTMREWWSCYEALNGIVDVIGIPYKEWGDRSGYIRCHYVWDIDDLNFIPFHLLGMWNCRELLFTGPRARSCDTSIPFRLAKRKIELDHSSADWVPFDFGMKLTEDEQMLASINIRNLKNLAAKRKIRPKGDL